MLKNKAIKARAIALRSQGMSIAGISRTLGKSQSTIYHWVQKVESLEKKRGVPRFVDIPLSPSTSPRVAVIVTDASGLSEVMRGLWK